MVYRKGTVEGFLGTKSLNTLPQPDTHVRLLSFSPLHFGYKGVRLFMAVSST